MLWKRRANCYSAVKSEIYFSIHVKLFAKNCNPFKSKGKTSNCITHKIESPFMISRLYFINRTLDRSQLCNHCIQFPKHPWEKQRIASDSLKAGPSLIKQKFYDSSNIVRSSRASFCRSSPGMSADSGHGRSKDTLCVRRSRSSRGWLEAEKQHHRFYRWISQSLLLIYTGSNKS